MPEYSGSLQSFELAVALWLAPLLPLVAALYAALGGYVGAGNDSDLPRAFRPRVVALAASVAALGIVAFHLVVLLGLPEDQRQLLSHAWGLLRVGSLDVSLTLSADPTTIMLAGVASVAGVAGIVLTAGQAPEAQRRCSAGVGLALGGALLVVLGDDLVLVLVGSFLSGLGALVLASRDEAAQAARGFALARIGDAALLGVSAVLLWGLSGSWTGGGDYVPDFRARLSAVQIGNAPPAPVEKERGRVQKDGIGFVSMAAMPGTSVQIGGAQLCATDIDGKRGGVGTLGQPCREIARSPFARLPLPVALHDIEATTGPGTLDLVVEKTRVTAGVETMLAVTGATIVIRELRDQLLMRDASGAFPLRAALSKRYVMGQPLLGLAGVLIGIFVLFRGLFAALASAQRASARSGPVALASLAGGVELWVGAAVVLRLDFLFNFIPTTSMLLGLAAAVAALLAAIRATYGFVVAESVVGIVLANALLCLSAAMFGAHSAAVAGLVVTAFGALAWVLTLAAIGDETFGDLRLLAARASSTSGLKRPLLLASLALAGAPLPMVGMFWVRERALGAAVMAESGLGYAAFSAGALASCLTAFGVWRLFFVAASGTAADKKVSRKATLEAFAFGAALISLSVGLLTHSHVLVGDAAPNLLDGWLSRPVEAAGAPTIDRGVRFGTLAMSFMFAFAGFIVARVRYGAARSSDWAKVESKRPFSVRFESPGDWSDRLCASPALGVARFVARFDGALEALVLGGAQPDPTPDVASSTVRAEDEARNETESNAGDLESNEPAVADSEPEPQAEKALEREPEPSASDAGQKPSATPHKKKKKKGRNS